MEITTAGAALHYARHLGLEVFPLVPGGKTPCQPKVGILRELIYVLPGAA